MQSLVAEKAPRTIVKEVEYATLYSDGTILVKEVRAAYPHLDEPYKGQDGEGKGKFGIVALMPKKAVYFPAKDIIRDEINKIIQAQKLPGLPAQNKFLKDGDLRPDKPEYVGHFTVNASENRRPALRGRGKDPRTGRATIIDPKDAADVFYGGCWVSVLLKPWYQNNKFGKKVNSNLLAVQFVREDEPFGTGRISDDAIDESFGVIGDDDSGYDDGIGQLTDEELDL